ncbi:MAG TPA: DUF3078 domain-containing protein [Saprospiraceae bacterium]|nr:DUF3078 domain-containing protein [Saprospiraceae bacterium]
MKKVLTLIVLSFGVITFSWSQETTEELQQTKTAKTAELEEAEAQLKEIQSQVNGLKSDLAQIKEQLTPYPRWKKGLLSNIGLNFSNFNNWLPKDQPSTSAVNIGLSTTGFVNAQFENAFWRNSANLTLGWLKFDNKDNPDDNDEFQVAADAFNITSLYGRNITKKIAVSILGEYRTSVLDGKLNNPGYLDLGVGATWTPIPDLVVVAHPLNYNFVFAEDDMNFNSSLGAKIVADYTRSFGNFGWKSNLSTFASYESSDLSNWTWVNNFSTAVKGIGVGLDIGLRNNKQEALSAGKTDNPLQTYWILGLSYAVSK